jgi:hypothetical protein
MMKLARFSVLLVVLILVVTACTSVAQVGRNGGPPNTPPNDPPNNPPPNPPQQVPEAPILVLLASGLLTLAAFRRRSTRLI